MSRSLSSRERGLWIGAVAVLATSLSWMAVLQLVWVSHLSASQSAALRAVARVVGHIVWSVLGWVPAGVMGFATLVVLAFLLHALVNGARPRQEIRHV
jgi:hypothetical protein